MSEFHSTPDVIMEKVVGLHQILPSQYFDVSGGHRLTAEQRLMLALMADAINVFQQGVVSRATRKRLLYLDAERWIMMAGKTAPHAFSFDTVCEALGINAGVLRRRLILWKHSVCRDFEPRAASSTSSGATASRRSAIACSSVGEDPATVSRSCACDGVVPHARPSSPMSSRRVGAVPRRPGCVDSPCRH